METTTQFGRRTRTKLVWSVLVLLRDSSSSLRTKKVLSLQSYMETTTQFGRRTRTKLVWSVLVLPAALFFQISRVVGTDHTKSVLPILERRGQKHPKIGELYEQQAASHSSNVEIFIFSRNPWEPFSDRIPQGNASFSSWNP